MMSPDELMAYVRTEHEKWAKVVKTSGAKVD
jgi:tripartite-type tricarboxylate transporter receptor subunit TctC